MRSYNEYAGASLSPSDKMNAKKITISFLQQLRINFPNQVAFKNAMGYVMGIMNGQDPQAKIIMQTMMSQPVTSAPAKTGMPPIAPPNLQGQ